MVYLTAGQEIPRGASERSVSCSRAAAAPRHHCPLVQALASPRNRSGCWGSCEFCCFPPWQVSFSFWAELRLLITAGGLFPQARAGSSLVGEGNQRAGPCVQAKPCLILTPSDRHSVTFFQSPAKGGGGTASAPSPLSVGSQGHDWFRLSHHCLLSCPPHTLTAQGAPSLRHNSVGPHLLSERRVCRPH